MEDHTGDVGPGSEREKLHEAEPMETVGESGPTLTHSEPIPQGAMRQTVARPARGSVSRGKGTHIQFIARADV